MKTADRLDVGRGGGRVSPRLQPVGGAGGVCRGEGIEVESTDGDEAAPGGRPTGRFHAENGRLPIIGEWEGGVGRQRLVSNQKQPPPQETC